MSANGSVINIGFVTYPLHIRKCPAMRAIKSVFIKIRCCVFCHFCHLPINVNKTIFIDFDKGRLKTFQTTFSLPQPYYQAALSKPLWRSSASMLGSRPRKALKDSAALREPPTARISCQKRLPVAATSSLSSKAA